MERYCPQCKQKIGDSRLRLCPTDEAELFDFASPESLESQPESAYSKPKPSWARWLISLSVGVLLLALLIYFRLLNHKTVVQPPAPTNSTAASSRKSLPNDFKLEMVHVPAGDFLMGSPAKERGRDDDEGPRHRVEIPAFAIGKYEVTQAQWKAVMDNNPSSFKGDDLPVENVSWNDAQEFCKRLSQLTGKTYRLPSEAEWEYAARAGTTGAYAGEFDAMAWNYKNSGNKTHPVGQKAPNRFGLFDMQGNLWEWCEDVYHDNYKGAPTDGSSWLSGADPSRRVLRGGSWALDKRGCRMASRFGVGAGGFGNIFGFRVVSAGAL